MATNGGGNGNIPGGLGGNGSGSMQNAFARDFWSKRNLEQLNEEIEKINRNFITNKTLLEKINELTAERKSLMEDIEQLDNDIESKERKIAQDKIALSNINQRAKGGKQAHKQLADAIAKEEAELAALKINLENKVQKNAERTRELRENEQRKAREGYTILDDYAEKLEGRTKAFSRGISEINQGIQKIGQGVSKIVGPWTKMSQAAADYAKNIGLSGKAMDALRQSSINLVDKGAFGIKYGTSVEELIKMRQSYTKAVGRQVRVTSADLENFAASSKILGEDNAVQFAAKLENFGVSMEEAGSRAGKMFSTASKSGIAWENYSKAFLDNISLAQRYNFKNGTEGLASMARKATEINLNMSQAAAFADKVSSVEGSVTTGANLQVLGGPFAQVANPLSMLYESLNDMEGLQDRMVQMFGNLGTFNSRTGEVEISSFNKQRIKAAAQSMGIDANNVFESINSSARRNEIARQLQGNTNIDAETAELLKNVGVIKNGKAGVSINGQFKEASNITNADRQYLQELARNESDDVKDIAQRLRGWDDTMTGFKKQREAAQGQLVERTGIGNSVMGIAQNVGEINSAMKVLAGATMVGGAAMMLGGGFAMAKGGARLIPGIHNIFRSNINKGSLNTVVQNGIYTENGVTYRYNGSEGAWREEGTNRLLRKHSTLDKAYKSLNEPKKFGGWVGKSGIRNAVGSGVGAGVLSGAITALEEFSGNNNHTTGRKWGATLSNAGGAAIGTIIGGALGPIGSILGGMAGQYLASRYIYNDQRRDRFKQELGLEGLNGDYRVKELKKIKNNNVDSKLLEKIRKNGDASLVEQLRRDPIDVNIVGRNRGRGRANGLEGGQIIGPSPSNGNDNVLTPVRSGEYVLTKEQYDNYIARPRRTSNMAIVAPTPMSPMSGQLTVKVDIGGTAKLDGPNGVNNLNIDMNAITREIEGKLSKKLTMAVSEGLERIPTGGRLKGNTPLLYQQGY